MPPHDYWLLFEELGGSQKMSMDYSSNYLKSTKINVEISTSSACALIIWDFNVKQVAMYITPPLLKLYDINVLINRIRAHSKEWGNETGYPAEYLQHNNQSVHRDKQFRIVSSTIVSTNLNELNAVVTKACKIDSDCALIYLSHFAQNRPGGQFRGAHTWSRNSPSHIGRRGNARYGRRIGRGIGAGYPRRRRNRTKRWTTTILMKSKRKKRFYLRIEFELVAMWIWKTIIDFICGDTLRTLMSNFPLHYWK